MNGRNIALNYLENIRSGKDIRKLSYEELEELCREIRSVIIDTVSKNGGHLASNLGTVELTVALLRLYDTEKDRILFDVGHQTYTHKILTGRYDRFHTLRQTGGISGFPNPAESPDDAFVTGHASTSVSLAVGMAKARTLRKEDYAVAAVIGDGSLTGGLAYEGLTNAAQCGEPLVIVINDNNMSIDTNVGGMANILQHMRTKPAYLSFKKRVRSSIMQYRNLYNTVHTVKEKIKTAILPANLFIDMGFEYLGPVDGHDLRELEEVLSMAKDMNGPTVVHVMTVKGKGYEPAEKDPDIFHGVGPFDAETGDLISNGTGFSDKLGEYLCTIAEENSDVVAITAAMSIGTGLERFKKQFPKRFFDVGIAEGHAVTFAAALAKQGITPVFAVYSSFLQRSFDMLIHDVALQDLHVVLCVDRAGLVGQDGMTHHGSFDLAYLRIVPNMKIYSCSSYLELHDMLRHAVFEETGPVAIRFSKEKEGAYKDSFLKEEQILCSGDHITMVGYGTEINEILQAAEELQKADIRAEVIKLGILYPNSFAETLRSLKKTKRLLVAEDACKEGSIGNSILQEAEKQNVAIEQACLLDLGNGVVPHGCISDLKKQFSLDAESIRDHVLQMKAEKHGENQT